MKSTTTGALAPTHAEGGQFATQLMAAVDAAHQTGSRAAFNAACHAIYDDTDLKVGSLTWHVTERTRILRETDFCTGSARTFTDIYHPKGEPVWR